MRLRISVRMACRVLAAIALAALVSEPARPQTRAEAPPRRVNLEETLRMGEHLKVRVVRPTTSPFTAVKVKGSAFVVALELDAGDGEAAIAYTLSTKSRASDLVLTAGRRRIAPFAVMDDFPAWGADNDREIEIVDPEEDDSISVNISGKGRIYILFDVPAELAESPKRFSAVLRMFGEEQEQYSFAVTL